VYIFTTRVVIYTDPSTQCGSWTMEHMLETLVKL
jgi:hypothetical protein